MKYIIIRGAASSGKSTTINTITKLLKPNLVFQKIEDDFVTVDVGVEINNGTFLIKVNDKSILIVAGSPTEQKTTITILIEFCVRKNITIDFAIVAMRSHERMFGYETKIELEKFGECILEEKINKIFGDDFLQTEEWNNRINKILNLININL